MASAGKVGVELALAIKPKVGVGPSTVAGGSVTLAAYALALVAFFQGARDDATLSLVVVGTVSLVTTLVGRFAQATAAVRLAKPQAAPSPPQPAPGGAPVGAVFSGSTWTGTNPGAAVAVTPLTDDELGDPDALPDYDTTENPPADVGDAHARPEDPA